MAASIKAVERPLRLRPSSSRRSSSLALLWHAWIGVRDIWMDYVKPTGLRLTLEVLTLVSLVVYAGWTIGILWGGK